MVIRACRTTSRCAAAAQKLLDALYRSSPVFSVNSQLLVCAVLQQLQSDEVVRQGLCGGQHASQTRPEGDTPVDQFAVHGFRNTPGVTSPIVFGATGERGGILGPAQQRRARAGGRVRRQRRPQGHRRARRAHRAAVPVEQRHTRALQEGLLGAHPARHPAVRPPGQARAPASQDVPLPQPTTSQSADYTAGLRHFCWILDSTTWSCIPPEQVYSCFLVPPGLQTRDDSHGSARVHRYDGEADRSRRRSRRRSGGPGSPGESNSPPKTRGRAGARGRIGKAKVSKASREGSEDLKDARFLYLSIDEAGTHVGIRHFRLLVREQCQPLPVVEG